MVWTDEAGGGARHRAVEAPARPLLLKPAAARRFSVSDRAMAYVSFGLAAFITWRLWTSLGATASRAGGDRLAQQEWLLSAVAHNIIALRNPLYTDLAGSPGIVNFLTQNAAIGVAVPFTPVTLIFGAPLAFALAVVAGLGGAAFGWYKVFGKITASPIAAGCGGLAVGFAPPAVAHANAELAWAVGFVPPLIVLALISAAAGRRPARTGALLGLALAWQFFIGWEALVVFGAAMAIFGVILALRAPFRAILHARAAVPALALAALVFGAVIAAPLLYQISGPGTHDPMPVKAIGNDLRSFTAFPTASLVGGGELTKKLPDNQIHEDSFLGWPLLVLLLLTAANLRRRRLVQAGAVTFAALGVLSLGGKLKIGGEEKEVALPWARLEQFPVLGAIEPSHLVFGMLPIIGLVLALGVDKALRSRSDRSMVWIVLAAAAVGPVIPMPFPAINTPEPIAFYARGGWRDYISDGAIVHVPLPSEGRVDMVRWQAATGFAFRMAGGQFTAQHAADKHSPLPHGGVGAPPLPSELLLREVRDSGKVPQISDRDKEQFQRDLAYWEGDAVVVADREGNRDQLVETLEKLLGFEGDEVMDATVWDVRAAAGPR
jgi:hypothetical protein